MTAYLEEYISRQKKTFDTIPLEKVAALIAVFEKALDEGRSIFVMGNGGSAASASHFVTDMGKGASDRTYRRFRCLALNDNTSWMTAISNDYSYEEVFSRQLMNLARSGDVVMAMSVSGNSPNLVRAFEWARASKMHTIGLVGGKRGRLAELSDSLIVIDDTHYGRVEDAHMAICHMIAFSFIESQVSSLKFKV